MKIVFCIYEFTPENLRLQPWLTVFEVSRALIRRGHSVEIITDVETPEELFGLRIRRVASLRGTNSGEVHEVLERSKPDCVVATVTPLNLATTGWHGALASSRWIAFASYPFYRTAELLRAFPHVRRSEFFAYFRHAFVPQAVWSKRLRDRYRAVICQSERTAGRLSRLTGSRIPIHTIAPGIDKERWQGIAVDGPPSRAISTFLYLGAASRIRGFYIALGAIKKLTGLSIRLRVLARGADEKRVREIQSEIAGYGLDGQVSVIGGWLEQEDLARHIREATAVLLPFILVPSELPVSVMEIIACGTPVIATDLDGIPSFVGQAGRIVPVGNTVALSEAMREVHENPATRTRWLTGVHQQTAKWETWDAVGERWLQVLNHA